MTVKSLGIVSGKRKLSIAENQYDKKEMTMNLNPNCSLNELIKFMCILQTKWQPQLGLTLLQKSVSVLIPQVRAFNISCAVHKSQKLHADREKN